MLFAPLDVTTHDIHHLEPNNPDWPNYAFVREARLAEGKFGFPLYENWGVWQALDTVFASYAASQPPEQASC
jgi:hypothetical protein